MKSCLFSGIIFLTTIGGLGCSLNAKNVATPDYSYWPKPYSRMLEVTHNGNRVLLLHELCYKGKLEEKMEFVLIVYNENQDSWLMFYDREAGDPNGSKPIPVERQIFENKYGKWVLVKDFKNAETHGSIIEQKDFLKEKYKLELK